jgi:hypothetical protein
VLRAEGEWRKTNLGTFVLAGLLALTTAACAAFIGGPLALAPGPARAPGALRWLAYFACLGTAFIVVEVALVQKCILFLGHPTHALAVVLFALLLWSALGSALSGRLDTARLAAVLAAVAALVATAALALSPLFDALVHLERPWRIAVVAAALAPLGLAMGMPLPMAVRLLARRQPAIIPWAWGVNGAFSVMGSAAALVIALFAGFDQALLVAAAVYAAALVAVRRASARPAAS